jgi:hypothetical protein
MKEILQKKQGYFQNSGKLEKAPPKDTGVRGGGAPYQGNYACDRTNCATVSMPLVQQNMSTLCTFSRV